MKKRESGGSVEAGRNKFGLGLDFSVGRMERRDDGRLNRAGEENEGRWTEGTEGQQNPCPGRLPRAMGLLRFRQGWAEADGERRIASLKAA